MRPRTRTPPELTRLAEHQDGVISRSQAIAAGLSRDSVKGLVASGVLRTISPGVYSLGDVGWDQFIRAGLLIAGPGSTIGGRAAACLMGMADRPSAIDVWAPRATSQRTRRGPWAFHRGHRSQVGDPPHSSVDETIVDICTHESPDGISAWVGKALSERRTTPRRLLDAIGTPCNVRNRRLIAECVQAASAGAHSPLEKRYLRDVESAHGLPPGRRQRSISDGTKSDVVYDEYRAIVELDGRAWHWGVRQNKDSFRDARHLAKGFVTMRFGWADTVSRPCETAALVTGALTARGWRGSLRRCPHCPGPGRST